MLSCEALEELARGKTDAWLGNATSLCAAFAQSFFEGTPEASDLRRSTALLESLVSMQRRCPRVFGGQASHWGIDAGHLFGAWTAERAMSTVANAASVALASATTTLSSNNGDASAPPVTQKPSESVTLLASVPV